MARRLLDGSDVDALSTAFLKKEFLVRNLGAFPAEKLTAATLLYDHEVDVAESSIVRIGKGEKRVGSLNKAELVKAL